MAKISNSVKEQDNAVKEQIERTLERYKERRKGQKKRESNIKFGGDWRKVETPSRVMRRMVALGLNELAGEMMATEAVTEGVESVMEPDVLGVVRHSA